MVFSPARIISGLPIASGASLGPDEVFSPAACEKCIRGGMATKRASLSLDSLESLESLDSLEPLEPRN